MNNALIIFTRNPELGKVKTRLAQSIGDEKALQVYRDLLQHTMEQTQSIACDKYVFYDTQIIENDIWDNNCFHKRLQATGDLGNKMEAAFDYLFELGYKKCIIIGSDLFDLTSDLIEKAFQMLDKKKIIIGPAQDGGYYLLGLKKMKKGLFQNKEWGTPSVLADTLSEINIAQVYFLITLNDIDTLDDLKQSNYHLK
ncbi:TIGR04282 family arsenosugar biosynthesis glycosyltransferase [Flavobacterium sp. UMI-01]|uniref:TIGR04282 family arsenosugar biosynthesis glycosyltransferase n=1 Tax=Flavobacterium sp. UMI-01 TaxID=1441053 RepID=UPI001C7E1891|nr:TIGR04282 family arsenosugar biosynthesis glycosyltransferase [Flavobacterium sp. UMI-01]GIZ10150.1 hypothetical protein FUMI01_28760 [Flavobacterium sp. UMI-01]